MKILVTMKRWTVFLLLTGSAFGQGLNTSDKGNPAASRTDQVSQNFPVSSDTAKTDCLRYYLDGKNQGKSQATTHSLLGCLLLGGCCGTGVVSAGVFKGEPSAVGVPDECITRYKQGYDDGYRAEAGKWLTVGVVVTLAEVALYVLPILLSGVQPL